MKRMLLAGSAATVAVFTASCALADVTAEEVWANWQEMMSASGQTLRTTDVSRNGNRLVVSGLTLDQKSDHSSAALSIDEIDFSENGDGKVTVTFSDSIPILIKTTPPPGLMDAKPSDLKITLSQPGLALVASGQADALTYVITAPKLTATLEALNGIDSALVDLTMNATLTNIAANYLVEGVGAAKKIASSFTADSMALVASSKNSDTQSAFDMTAQIEAISGQSSGTLTDMADMAKALTAGFAVTSSFDYASAKFDVSANNKGVGSHVSGATLAGGLAFAMDKKHLRYDLHNSGTALSFSGPDLPVPQVDVTYDELAFMIDMPTGKSDTPSDFAFLSKLVGFNVSEPVWAMVDPAGVLPHEGATVILDAKGKASLNTDLFDELQQGTSGEAAKGELNALDLSQLQLSFAGAELTGTGALTFDNSDLETFSGLPVPTGKIDLKLTGANSLLDKIVAMGYLNEQDVMGYKMMMAMFTNSAPDKDELTSVLEFKDKGFYANGQRLQ